MSESVKRIRYTTGLFMDDTEFQTEQDYHIRMRRMHNRHLHTPGIVWGLELGGSGLTVTIGSGMALSAYEDETGEELSREIVVPAGGSVTFPQSEYVAGDSVFVWLEYAELEANSDPKAGGDNIHWEETFAINHSKTAPLDDLNKIILGKAIIDGEGKISGFDYDDGTGNDIRKFAGFKGTEWETDKLIFSDPEIAGNKPFIEANVFPKEEPDSSDPGANSGLILHSEKTSLTGKLEVAGNTVLQSELNVAGDVTMQGSSLTVNSSEVNIQDNILNLNSPDPVSFEEAGLEIKRPASDTSDGTSFRILYNEEERRLKAGFTGSEEVLATINEMDAKDFLQALNQNDQLKRFKIKVYDNGDVHYSFDGGNFRPFG